MGKQLTQADFLSRSRKAHGDRYDYSRSVYVRNSDPIKIDCLVHGEFLQKASHHMDGRGCPKCRHEATSARCRSSTDEFIGKARVAHGDRYDYSRVRYRRSSEKVRIGCPVHGVFLQTPNNHLKPSGCPKCQGKGLSTVEFIDKARTVHGDHFGYHETDYEKIKSKVTIHCSVHGPFQQSAEGHLVGHGCPHCWAESATSSGEREVSDWIESLGVAVSRNTRDVLPGFELDIFLPSLNLGVEYNGCYWHSHRVKKNHRHHEFKTEAARRAGIRLVTVWDFDWAHRQGRIKSVLRHAVGVNSSWRAGARECAVVQVPSVYAAEFFHAHHIQGAPRGSIVNLGLSHDGRLVACMSFSRGVHRRGLSEAGHFELTRYATACVVPGGAGRLFQRFLCDHDPDVVWSFSDIQYFSGALYRLLGFQEDKRLPADYRVVDPRTLKAWHKSLWQRTSIPKRLRELGLSESFDPRTDPRTEHEMHDVAKVLRVYDSGKVRWKWSADDS